VALLYHPGTRLRELRKDAKKWLGNLVPRINVENGTKLRFLLE
jgi:hypothetical protein